MNDQSSRHGQDEETGYSNDHCLTHDGLRHCAPPRAAGYNRAAPMSSINQGGGKRRLAGTFLILIKGSIGVPWFKGA
jgi:hypothetical protein